MTKEERIERREARKQMTRIRNAWKRFEKKKPSEEEFLRVGFEAGLIKGPAYEISKEDWETLEPVFRAEYKEVLNIEGRHEIEITGQLMPVCCLTMRERYFISILASDDEADYLKKRARKILLFFN